jgi:hypothetical protein
MDLASSESSALVPIDSHGPYPDWVRDMAFGQYILADRNAAAAHRYMTQIWDDDWGEPPDKKTVQRWARTLNWDYQADLLISEQYPSLYQRDLARLIAMRGKAISTYSQLMDGTYAGPNPMAAAQVSKHTIDMTMAGISVQAPRSHEEDLDIGVKERSKRQRERLERGRGGKRSLG